VFLWDPALLDGGKSTKAGYLAGAFRRIGRAELADAIELPPGEHKFIVLCQSHGLLFIAE
jgi:hypothetical protein